ncbi:hypothetical protein SFC65_18935 [Priestia filamentosa]|uniref:hypothetical protein n=1 Tax=Priestia filamentosa TaxID=1402861 RepID=UPI0039827AC7
MLELLLFKLAEYCLISAGVMGALFLFCYKGAAKDNVILKWIIPLITSLCSGGIIIYALYYMEGEWRPLDIAFIGIFITLSSLLTLFIVLIIEICRKVARNKQVQ